VLWQNGVKKKFAEILTMERLPTWLAVVAAAIRDRQGRVLLQQALAGKRHAGQWEFPGGKVENEENPRLALVREVREELDLVLDPLAMRPLGFADEPVADDRPAIVLFLYDCPCWEGEPQALDGQAFGWFTLAGARALGLAPMDRALLEHSPW
jgi:8-oxo-dGTP diphosphatase